MRQIRAIRNGRIVKYVFVLSRERVHECVSSKERMPWRIDSRCDSRCGTRFFISHLCDRYAGDDSWRTAVRDALPVAYPSKDSGCYRNCSLSAAARARTIACRATGPWRSSSSSSSRKYRADYFIDVPHCLSRRRASPISKLLSVPWKKSKRRSLVKQTDTLW